MKLRGALPSELTPFQARLLELLWSPTVSNRELSRRLGVSPRSLKFQLMEIYRKFGMGGEGLGGRAKRYKLLNLIGHFVVTVKWVPFDPIAVAPPNVKFK